MTLPSSTTPPATTTAANAVTHPLGSTTPTSPSNGGSAATATATGGRGPINIDLGRLSPEQAINRLVAFAVMLPASDLFFQTEENSVNVAVRHLGIVQTVASLNADVGRRALAHVKAMAGLDTAEKRRPQDGRWIHRDDLGHNVDMRMNMIPTRYGEDLAIRILATDAKLYDIDQIGLNRQQHDTVLSMLESPSGLILMTGPTGSGKTATLYACLTRLNDGRRKINTIEDPIEYAMPGLRQSQVNASLDLGFSELLRSVLRQSPDVIMVGEVRDAETAETAVRAANSGHLVFATLHAPVAAAGVQSMRGLGVHPHFLASSLRGVISQRLVRTLCPNCKQAFDLDMAPHTFDEVRPWLAPGEGNVLYAPNGCEQCQMLGYAGRTGVFEVMPITRALRDLISAGRPTGELRAQAVAEGMLEFRQSALLKVARGITSTEEVFRVIPTEHLLEETGPA